MSAYVPGSLRLGHTGYVDRISCRMKRDLHMSTPQAYETATSSPGLLVTALPQTCVQTASVHSASGWARKSPQTGSITTKMVETPNVTTSMNSGSDSWFGRTSIFPHLCTPTTSAPWHCTAQAASQLPKGSPKLGQNLTRSRIWTAGIYVLSISGKPFWGYVLTNSHLGVFFGAGSVIWLAFNVSKRTPSPFFWGVQILKQKTPQQMPRTADQRTSSSRAETARNGRALEGTRGFSGSAATASLPRPR